MSRTTPIVIQLKKRTAPGATPPSEDVDAGAPPDPPPPPPQDDRDKSSSSSPRRDRARAKEDGQIVGSFASIDSMMDLTSLAALFRKLHEEVEAFAHRESQKLAEQEKRNRQAQTNFKEAFGAARGFLEEFAPDGGLPEPVDDASDGGDSGSGDDDQGSDAPARRRRRSAKMDFETEQEQLTKKLLPQLVRFATEDQRALQDAAELLTFFVQRHFPDNKELADLAQKPSPEKLLKGLLGVLEKELQPRTGGGKDEKVSDQEDEREERDRGDRGEGSAEKERRYREERDGRHRDDRERDGRDRGRDGGRDMRDGRDGRRDDRRGDDRGRFEERRGERDRGGRPGDPRGGDRRDRKSVV